MYILKYFSNVFVKQWSLPFCAFFTTFSIVMTVLILSTDLRGHHYMQFNSSILWDFEEVSQSSPLLCSLIRDKYIISPQITTTELKNYTGKPSHQMLKLFKRKKNGTFVELEADGEGETEWLERILGWRGLLTQPHPQEFINLLNLRRPKSNLAQVCISPTTYPKHAFFRNSTTSSNETLTAVPCFPLYSLLRAFNDGSVDFLSFNIVTAPLQVLKSLPPRRVRIKVLSLLNHDDGEIYEDICCDINMKTLLEGWGYRTANACPSSKTRCYYLCIRTYCPFPA